MRNVTHFYFQIFPEVCALFRRGVLKLFLDMHGHRIHRVCSEVSLCMRAYLYENNFESHISAFMRI